MKKNSHWFTFIELVITITILWILTSISYISMNLIWESAINNISQDAKTFIENIKTDIIREKASEVYLYFWSEEFKNKYIFWYSFDNNCDHISNIDTLFLSWYILDKYDYVDLSWSILSGTLNGYSEIGRNNREKISFTGATYTHFVWNNSTFIYNLYGTGTKNIDGIDTKVILHCGDIKVYFFDKKKKKTYQIQRVSLNSNGFIQSKHYIKLKFSSKTLKPEVYLNGMNSRSFFDSIIITLENIIDHINVDMEL